MMVSRLILGTLLVIAFSVCKCQAQTLKIWPDEDRGNGVSYGADVKLTMYRIIRNVSATSAVNQRYKNDLKMDLVRLPMIAKWGAADHRHKVELKGYAQDVKNKGMKVYLSVANTNGVLLSNNILDDAHNANKFASWMFCNGCSNSGLYNINRDQYKSWLNNLVFNSLGSSLVDYVGPWNEDPASLNDYADVDVGKTMVGVETKLLVDAAGRYNNVKSAIDVAGAHNYNQNHNNPPNLKDAYNEWQAFRAVANKPEWFTETTLYGMSTAEGIAHMLPAISAGIEKMIIYQTTPRIIDYNGSNGPHYAATKRLIDYSKGKGPALRVETNDRYGIIAAFRDGNDKLQIHLCNVSVSQRTMTIKLQNGYKITSVSKQTYGGSVSSTFIQNQGMDIQVVIQSKTYAHITASGLSTSTGPPPPPPPTPSPTPSPPTPPTPSSGYNYVTHKASGRRLWADPETTVVGTQPSSYSGNQVEWSLVPKNSEWDHLVHQESGLKLYSEDINKMELHGTTNRKAQWRFVDAGGGYSHIEHRKTGFWLHMLTNGSDFRLTSTTGENTKWRLEAA